jgi:hypothetical protein
MENVKNLKQDYSHIKGWGVDADRRNDPTYPMRNRDEDDHQGYDWDRPQQQPVNIEVLQSVERPRYSAVFGTSLPPLGLSGRIRRFAYRYSEANPVHWVPLLIADRVNVIEGIIDDLKKGHVPNIPAERGIMADWKYDKKLLFKTAFITVFITTSLIGFYTRRKKMVAIAD